MLRPRSGADRAAYRLAGLWPAVQNGRDASCPDTDSGTMIGRSSSSRLPGPSMSWGLCLCTIAVLWAGDPRSAQAQLTGHGGPVRAVAVSADGRSVLSGSFDTSAIRWSLATEFAEQVLRFHSDAVNAVAFLKDGRMVTAGADARIAIWTAGRQQPDRVFDGHRAPIVSLAVSPDGTRLASASWDHTVRLWSLVDGTQRVLE